MIDFYQRIGQAATKVAGNAKSRVLLYSEVEDGAISFDLFFQLPGEHVVRFRFAPEALKELVYAFWEAGENNVKPQSWAAMRFVVADGKFAIELVYPEQLNPDEGLPDRRPRVIADCFPNREVDYSRPNG